VVVSADGRYLMLTPRPGQLHVSSDGGNTWTPRGPSQRWDAGAMSADGSRMVAVNGNSGFIYTSADFGENWTPRHVTGFWAGVASSDDGRVLAAANGSGVHVSEDFGATWTERLTAFIDAVACSADCGRIVGGGLFRPVRTSPQRTFEGVGRGLAGFAGSTVELQYLGSGAWTILGYAGDVKTR
jgi:photosystem II stability/assembly factor-like uncharacterized protein